MQRKLLGIISMDIHATGQPQNIYSALEKKDWNTILRQCMAIYRLQEGL
jgi:hypothetical protein